MEWMFDLLRLLFGNPVDGRRFGRSPHRFRKVAFQTILEDIRSNMRLTKYVLMRSNGLVRKGFFCRKIFIRAVFGVKIVADVSTQSYCEWNTLLSFALLSKYLPRVTAQVLDMGAGAHALLAICAKKHSPGIAVWATDIVSDRVEWARRTADANGVAINCLVADMWDGLERRFDLVICNPPAIPQNELAELGYRRSETPGLEPRYCWSGDGGEDGLSFIRPFLANLGEHLSSHGCAIMCINPCHISRQCIEQLCAHSRIKVKRIHRWPGIMNGYIIGS